MKIKSATDEAIYNRAKQGHDGTLTEFVKWYERGQKPKPNRKNQRNKAEYRKAQEIIREFRKDFSGPEIADSMGLNQQTIYDLQHGYFYKVGLGSAQKVMAFEGEIHTDRVIVKEETHKKAREVVQDMYEREQNMNVVSRKTGITANRLWKLHKGEYLNPNVVALEVLEICAN